jgi:hypothetical protein
MAQRAKINRPITQEEKAVILATLERAAVSPEFKALGASVDNLRAVDQCDCGCASVDFVEGGSLQPAMPIGDGMGTTAAGGVVGVIVWGRDGGITGLEVYELGSDDDGLRLPVPTTIRSLGEGAA